jgi:hypothetical protein
VLVELEPALVSTLVIAPPLANVKTPKAVPPIATTMVVIAIATAIFVRPRVSMFRLGVTID